MAVPWTPHYRAALARGNTLPGRSCIHPVAPSKDWWLDEQRRRGSRVVAVELAECGTPLPSGASVERTVVLLGHEHHGVPPEVLHAVDETIVIPMTGQGASLNAAGGLARPLPARRTDVTSSLCDARVGLNWLASGN